MAAVVAQLCIDSFQYEVDEWKIGFDGIFLFLVLQFLQFGLNLFITSQAVSTLHIRYLLKPFELAICCLYSCLSPVWGEVITTLTRVTLSGSPRPFPARHLYPHPAKYDTTSERELHVSLLSF